VNSNPPDTRIILISRTIGIDRIVDEMFIINKCIGFCQEFLQPTNLLKFQLLQLFNFREDKLCNEHIYWDQASVLVQIGLLDNEGLPVTEQKNYWIIAFLVIN